MGLLALGATSASAQPGPSPAADLAKQGTDLYNAGDYPGAVAALEKAVELEPNNFEYRFTLAQALRLSNQCDRARPIYKALVDAASDPQRKTDIQAEMAQCPEPVVTPPPPPPEPEPPPAPPPIESSGRVSKGNAFMLMGGGALVGAGAVLLFAGYTHSGDADAARTVNDHDRISGRATTEYVLGAVGIAAGLTLSALAMYRISVSNEHDTTVAFQPRAGGGSFVMERSW